MTTETPGELGDALRSLRAESDASMREQWNRSLPFADTLFDRWHRAAALGFGEQTSIYDSAVVLGSVSVGAGTWIGPYVMLDGSGAPLTIGDGCDISAGVHLYTHDTAMRCISGGALPIRDAPINVGDQTYIGSQAVVVPGVTIGSRCVVGANSFVNSDVPDRAVVAGTPARLIGRVEGEGSDTRIIYDR